MGRVDDTLPSGGIPSLDNLPVNDVADLLLAALARRRLVAIVVEPGASRHLIRGERGAETVLLADVDAATGDAVVARLSILAGVELDGQHDRAGRLRTSAARSMDRTDVLIVVRATPDGLSAELRSVPNPSDANVAPLPLEEEGDVRHIGPYRLTGELGRGGMGVVYRAEHVMLQKPVAVKVLFPTLAIDPEVSARFVVEARAACRARHPGIVDVTDFGRLADGRAYLVMELVEGPTLDEVLAAGPLPPNRAITIAAQIAAALRAAAASGVVHRDLKPSNIFVLADGHEDKVKIGDFGVAQMGSTPRKDTARRIVGTAAYMSPEQARGELADPRSDIYSLGCVLFHMLTGRAPYEGKLSELLQQQASAPVPPVVGPDGALPDALVRVVQRAMAKRREERYQDADELIADLGRVARVVVRRGWRRYLPS